MIDVFAKIGLINCLIALFLGIQIIIRKRSWENFTFNLLAFSIAFWSFGYWMWLSVSNAKEALIWVKIFTLGSILIPVFYFYWVTTLLGVAKKYKYTLAIFFIVSITLIFNTFFSDLLVVGTREKLIFPFWPIPGILYLFYVIVLYGGLVIGSLYALWTSYKETKDKDKCSQIKYIFWGSVIGFSGGLSNFFLWYDILIPPYLNFLVCIGLLMFYYAASKNNLFNMKVIATEFFAYFLGFAMAVRFIFGSTLRERLMDGGVLVLVIIVGYQLTRSVRREVEQRERLEQLTKELESANEKLRELDHLKSEFLSFASHQIKAPLAAIKGFATLIFDGTYGEINEKAKEAAFKIKNSADRLTQLVINFINVRKIEEGKMEYKFENINVGKMVKDIYEELKPLADTKSLTFNIELCQKELIVNADSQNIRQVFQNLVENAIKYTDKGGVSIKTECQNEEMVFSVADTGHGISHDLLPHLFEEFRRGGGDKKIEGSGLGLYIAKAIVEAHKGKIWAESSGLGLGSVFLVKLPLIKE